MPQFTRPGPAHPVPIEPEEWRAIPGWKGYEASTLGRIRSLDRHSAAGSKIRGLMRRLVAGKEGYSTIHLHKDGRSHFHRVARLIAITWVPLPEGFDPAELEVAHINRVSDDDRAVNLEWRSGDLNRPLGEEQAWAKLTASSVRAIRILAGEGVEIGSLARAYGVAVGTVRDALHGVTWKHVE